MEIEEYSHFPTNLIPRREAPRSLKGIQPQEHIRILPKKQVLMTNIKNGDGNGNQSLFHNLHNFKAETPPLSNLDSFDPINNLRSIEALRAWTPNNISNNPTVPLR